MTAAATEPARHGDARLFASIAVGCGALAVGSLLAVVITDPGLALSGHAYEDAMTAIVWASLSWLLGRPGVTSVIIGGRNESQFRDNIAAAGLVLSPQERERLDAASRPPLLYPYWHQSFTAQDRLGAVDLDLIRPYAEEFKRG